jgi:hypothetical protein
MSTTLNAGGERMLTIEQITKALEDRKLRVVARETGLHYHTLRRIKHGETTNPSFGTVKLLSDYLTRKVGS